MMDKASLEPNKEVATMMLSSTEEQSVLPLEPQQQEQKNQNISYWELLRDYREYRYFILSYLVTHMGEWLNYIASIDFIERQHQQMEELNIDGAASDGSSSNNHNRTSIAVLIIVRLLPNVIGSGFGGSLADRLDRRHLLIGLDLLGSFCAIGFLLSVMWYESVFALYVVTFVQQFIAGLYEPSHAAMIPQLVRHHPGALKKATTLEGVAWSAMTALGASVSGILVQTVGIPSCFVMDGLTYLVSALLLWMVRGDYKVLQSSDHKCSITEADDTDTIAASGNHAKKSFSQQCRQSIYEFWIMTKEGVYYIQSSFFGPLIGIKALSALMYGACDILNVAFSEQAPFDQQGDDTMSAIEKDRDWKLGALFAMVGVGCFMGPLLIEPWVQLERPITLQRSCIFSYGLMTIGYVGWSIQGSPFRAIVGWSVPRAAGSSIAWIHSTLLLQTFASTDMLGRVLAADLAFSLLAEAISAFGCSWLMDHRNFEAWQVSRVLTGLSVVSLLSLTYFHWSGRGAAAKEATKPTSGNEDDNMEMTPMIATSS